MGNQLNRNADISNAASASLETLPHELLWKIIDKTPNSVQSLRLTSRSLQSAVDAYALVSGGIELVHELRIYGFAGNGHPPEIEICFEIPKDRVNVFEHRLKQRAQPNCQFGQVKRSVIRQISRPPNWQIGRFDRYRFAYNVGEDAESFPEYLGGCLGTRIGKVKLHRCANDIELSIVLKLMKGMAIRELDVSAEEAVIEHLLKPIDMYQVEKLTIFAGTVSVSDPVELLIHLSSLVRAMHIRQFKVDGLEINCSYFFGVHNMDWAPIILEMFSRKLDKLKLTNEEYPGYLWHSSVRILTESLPTLGKKIWFNATTDCSVGFKADTNDHIAKVYTNARYFHTFRVKHSSLEVDF